MARLVGVYGTGEGEALGIMREKIGLNLVIGGGGVPSEKTLAKAPFKVAVEAEDPLPKAVEEAHRRGMKFWICHGGYADMGNMPVENPELGFIDIWGRQLIPDKKTGYNSSSCCPSNPRLREYYSAYYYDVAKKYDVDGFTLTHVRYAPLGNHYLNFFGCGCGNCQKAAARLGYDFPRMRKGLENLMEGLKRIDPAQARRMAETNIGFFDFLMYLGPDSSLIDWVRFRCEIILENFREFYSSAKSARESIVFGSDNHPPSFALTVGNNYREFDKAADFLSPLLPHPFLFQIMSFTETARSLLEWNRGLQETDALRLLYMLFGYDELDMPETIDGLIPRFPVPSSDYSETKVPMPEVVAMEARKAKAASTGRVPIYGIVAAHQLITPDGAARRVKAMLDAGMEGVILQVGQLPGPPANLDAIGRVLRG